MVNNPTPAQSPKITELRGAHTPITPILSFWTEPPGGCTIPSVPYDANLPCMQRTRHPAISETKAGTTEFEMA